MNQIKAELIAIGTELLLGQIVNTNAKWLSEQLALHGINTFYHTVVGDNQDRVTAVFKQAQERSNLMIVTGGLGPTEDDMTREAFQEITGLELIEHENSIQKIESYFKKQQLDMTPNNYRQARVFKNSKVIENKYGMAPGMIIDLQGKTWIFLPGVPREMKQMTTDTVFPFILKKMKQKTIIQSMILRFVGIGEAKLEYELRDLIQSQQNPTIALLAQQDGLIIRLTVKDSSVEKAQQKLVYVKNQIEGRVGKYLYGVNEETIERKIVHMLNEHGKRISIAESMTGGLFTEKIISVKGASNICPGGIVCYDAKIKQDLLEVPTKVIETYGVVSEECAKEMAKNIMRKMNTDIGMSFTGVAGPEKLEGHEVGTVYISLYDKSGKYIVERFLLNGDRNIIRNRAILKGFEMLFNFLKN